MNRKRQATVVAVTAAAVIGGIVIVPRVVESQEPDAIADATTASAEPETVQVQRRDLTETAKTNGTLGFGETSTLPIDAQGIVTQAPAVGDQLEPGDVVVEVGGRPVTLAHGAQPLFRELRRVTSNERDPAGDRLGLQTGDDVTQLQTFLLQQGHDDSGRLKTDGTFGLSTERAVKSWQREVGHPATGKVDRTQLIFVDGAVRIDQTSPVGQPFGSIATSSTSPTVTATVSTRQRSFFEIGQRVDLEAATSSATGTVTKLERATSADGSIQLEVRIEIDDAGTLGTADSVEVISGREVASNALTVPVRALIALADGGWALQRQSGNGPELTGVELGAIVDGFAEINGVDEGTVVVVPS